MIINHDKRHVKTHDHFYNKTYDKMHDNTNDKSMSVINVMINKHMINVWYTCDDETFLTQ